MSTVPSRLDAGESIRPLSQGRDQDTWIARWELLRYLSVESFHELLDSSAQLRLTRHQLVFRQGELVNRLYLVDSGSVKLVRHSELGKEMIVSVPSRGGTFGAMTAPAESAHLAEALQESTLIVIPVAAIRRAAYGSPRFAMALVDDVEARRRDAEASAFRIAFDTVPARLAHALLRQCDEVTGELLAPLNQTELAHLIGSSRETVCSVLNRFRRNGLLQIERGRLRLVARDLLDRVR